MNLSQGFPQITAPIVDDQGRLQQAWYQLLITLWNRTGGGGNGPTKAWVFPEDYGANVGMGGDDTLAFQRALDSGFNVQAVPGKTYLVADLTCGVEINLNGAVLKPYTGADWLVKLNAQGAAIRNGYVNDPDLVTLKATVTAVPALSGQADIVVDNAEHFEAGKLCAVLLSDGTHQVAKIDAVSGSNITLLDDLRDTVDAGATVETCHGLIMVDQALNGAVSGIISPVSPMLLEVVNTVEPALTHDLSVSYLRADAFHLCGVFLDVQAAVCNFADITLYGHAGSENGYVGVYQEGRNTGIYPTGGHSWTNINALTGERGWQIRGAELTTYTNCVGDTCSGDAWNIGAGSQKLRFDNVFGATADRGMVVEEACLGIILNGLYTRFNTTTDLYVSADSEVYNDDELWAESQNFSGGGTYNQVFPTHLGGAPGNESVRITNHGPTQVNRWELEGNTSGNGVILSATGSDSNVDGYIIAKGDASITVQTGDASAPVTQLRVGGPDDAANNFVAQGGPTGTGAILFVEGSDTNIDAYIAAKGAGRLIVQVDSAGSPATAMEVTAPIDAVNYLVITGAASTNALSIVATGDDSNIAVDLYGKGTGEVRIGNGGGKQFGVGYTASAVNNLAAKGAAAGDGVTLYSEGASANVPIYIFAKGASNIFFQVDSATQAYIGGPASAVNQVGLQGNTTGNPAGIVTNADDLALAPASGIVRFGTHSALAGETVTGYITVKDAGGTTRKLAVVS